MDCCQWNTKDIGRCCDVMRTLVTKYPDGYEGWAKEKGEDVVAR